MNSRKQAFIYSFTEKLLDEGFIVYSHLPGYFSPPAIEDYKPDRLARGAFQKRIIAIKSAETYDRDSPDLATFRLYSLKTPGVSLQVYTIDKDGECRLVESTGNVQPED